MSSLSTIEGLIVKIYPLAERDQILKIITQRGLKDILYFGGQTSQKRGRALSFLHARLEIEKKKTSLTLKNLDALELFDVIQSPLHWALSHSWLALLMQSHEQGEYYELLLEALKTLCTKDQKSISHLWTIHIQFIGRWINQSGFWSSFSLCSQCGKHLNEAFYGFLGNGLSCQLCKNNKDIHNLGPDIRQYLETSLAKPFAESLRFVQSSREQRQTLAFLSFLLKSLFETKTKWSQYATLSLFDVKP